MAAADTIDALAALAASIGGAVSTVSASRSSSTTAVVAAAQQAVPVAPSTMPDLSAYAVPAAIAVGAALLLRRM